MATSKPKPHDVSLPFASLRLLAPPVRLVSAALWKVLKQRDVMQYGVVEEFVTSACETVPGLLTTRHQGKLALGLRARLILELCRTQPDVKVIEAHLERICVPAAASSSSAPSSRKDVKILRTVEGFHSLVHILLKDAAVKEQFFKEEFPAEYGPKFDQELEKLLWEFLIRTDQLLPVPNLAQTVSWLSDAPPVLEECPWAATQPQLLDILLEHQTRLGHLESAASLPPNMGDSILASLSLPPSGKVSTNQLTGARSSSVAQSDGSQRVKAPFIAPVIGLVSNEDVPVMIAARRRTLQRQDSADAKDTTSEKVDPNESLKFTLLKPRHKAEDDGGNEGGEPAERERSTMKRKQPDEGESEEEEEDVFCRIRSGKRRISRHSPGKGERRTDESEEVLETYLTQLGVRTFPQDPSLRSIFASCVSSRPRVVLQKLPAASVGAGGSDRRGTSTHRRTQSRRTPASELPGLDDKENHPVSSSPALHRSNTEVSAPSGDTDDYVDDSEDEATKNFKVRLFMKRYYKTKHGTYIPTLREFWKPGMTRRVLLSDDSGCRR
ncbi:TERF1-interacting nuclear factor 2 isoform X1 [Brachyistius frenatus]|uniref:TERF1-interacting nuclear factor 2 isoform X1 n=1 Tax=Brachyistius frenatus TaxID=100188 RepID=UPI0037E7F27F